MPGWEQLAAQGASDLGSAIFNEINYQRDKQRQDQLIAQERGWQIDDRNATWNREDQLRSEAYARDDTKMQRYTDDLKASGINPMLAAGSGGPSQSSPSVVTGAGNNRVSQSQVQRGNIRVADPLVRSQLGLATSQMGKIDADAQLSREQAEYWDSQTPTRGNSADSNIKRIEAEVEAMRMNADTNRMGFYRNVAETVLKGLSNPVAVSAAGSIALGEALMGLDISDPASLGVLGDKIQDTVSDVVKGVQPVTDAVKKIMDTAKGLGGAAARGVGNLLNNALEQIKEDAATVRGLFKGGK